MLTEELTTASYLCLFDCMCVTVWYFLYFQSFVFTENVVGWHRSTAFNDMGMIYEVDGRRARLYFG